MDIETYPAGSKLMSLPINDLLSLADTRIIGLRKPPLKVAKKYSNCFFPTALCCPNDPKKEIMIQDVAYRPTAYKTGVSALRSTVSSLLL